MTDLATLLQQGSSNAWLFIPSAILLGALHGLEPGHSKTMMAAFIVAIRGSVKQAIMLGLAATISHTAVVWLVAMGGLYFGSQWNVEASEPYFQLASGLIILAVAAWMVWRTWRDRNGHHHHDHDHHDHHHHDHDHSHGVHEHDEPVKRIETGFGMVELEVYEAGVPPRFRLRADSEVQGEWTAGTVKIETERPDGARQAFALVQRDGFLESVDEIPEPHEFIARVSHVHGAHTHNYDVEFTEHGHDHAVPALDAMAAIAADAQDAHELAHANDIRRRFANRAVSNGQILIFGLTGGLVPCPAAITVLMLCLQLKRVSLGASLVVCFSIGLALTLVMSGVLAAVGVRHAAKRWSGFGDLARKAPYFSGGLISLVGLYVAAHGAITLLK